MAETIAAIATAVGRGGIGVVRISGALVPVIARALLGVVPDVRRATLCEFKDINGDAIDKGIALFFSQPHSYTGEDVLELQGHGGPIILEALLMRALELGARRAQPGEFTQRAYLNNKLDLAQAEAVADLINAGSREAARAALRSLQGSFSTQIYDLTEAIIELRVWVEAAIDFPEEEIDFLEDPNLQNKISGLKTRFFTVQQAAAQGRALCEGMTVVIAGRPNAGKSSLLNALVGHEAAIVTSTPGTTRDVLREQIHLDGMPLHILDTAGLRNREALNEADFTDDPIEVEGIRRARAEMIRADLVLFVVDAAADPKALSYQQELSSLPAGVPVTVVFNKSDLCSDLILLVPASAQKVSAKTGIGLQTLRGHLKNIMGYATPDVATFSARARHLDALKLAQRHTELAFAQLNKTRAGELVAEELRAAQKALGLINGEFSSDDLLGRIFSSFCIGK